MRFNRLIYSLISIAFLSISASLSLVVAAERASNNAAPVRIVALGDSLTAGYQLPRNDAFPVQLEAALRKKGYNVIVMNSGVSGDTAAAGLERLAWSLPDKFDAVILELGANDALRGLSPAVTKHALQDIVQKLKARNAEILIAGMQAPTSYGTDYVESFNDIFPSIAKDYNLLLYPFFLKGVALRPDLSLSDGLHPNKKGVAKIVQNILPKVEELVKLVYKKKRFEIKRAELN